MLVNKSIKGILAALIAASTLTSVAYAEVSCPSADDIKGADKALNAVIRQSQKNFFVLSAGPAVNANDHDWIIAAQASASSFDAAYTSGQNDVKSVSMPAMETAIEQQGLYICAYFTSTGRMSVMAASQQQQGFAFNPATINMQAFQAKK